ncbi:MAG: prolyl oligopeptidase family serine peptidase, partial [Bacteroidota bacterium]
AWIQTRASKKKDRTVGDLYYTRLEAKADGSYPVVQLTRTEDSDRSPMFSPDGKDLYFLSNRKGGKSLWNMHLGGGEPYVVDSFPNGFSQPKWWRDSLLVFVAKEGKTQRERELKKAKDNVQVVEDTAHFMATRLFSFDPKTKTRQRLSDNRYPIQSYALSPDGTWAVTSHVRSPHYGSDGKPAPVQYLWNLNTGESTLILEGLQTPGNFQFTRDSKGVYFSAQQSSDPEWQGAGISLLYHFSVGAQSFEKVPLDWDWGMGGGFVVRGQDVLVSLANGTTRILKFYRKQNDRWQGGEATAGEMDEYLDLNTISKDGKRAVMLHSTASKPREYHLFDLTNAGNTLQLTDQGVLTKINDHLAKKTIAKTERLKWKGALNEEVTGMLYYPHDYEAGKRYPLMVAIHGGPSGVDMDRWSDRWAYPHNLLTQEGMFILKTNYHGSSNHGQEFVESIKKHYYEYELPDILTGIGELVDRGLVDRDSLALIGWSNGAILATMLTVEYPDMFLAAAAGAGDVNWSSDYGTCAFGVTFDQSYFGGAPWDDVDGLTYNPAYILKSPLFEMEKVTTPTLIHHGSEDRAVPRDQGWEYYRALQQNGKAPVRFLWYPGQPHGLGKLSHQRRKMQEEMRWFHTYFFGKEDTTSEVLKKGSPLMALKTQNRTAQQDGLYGYMANKTLLPEMAKIHPDSISISRYEITNAQFQQFRPEHRYPAPHGNHPVSLTGEEAMAYIQWLNEQTGDRYRLPTKAEAQALHKQARKVAGKENSLSYWAGYSPTREEVEPLEALLPEERFSMVKAVGSFGPTKVGKASIYDLGGNLAEWYQDGNNYRLYGFGAGDWVDPSDTNLPNTTFHSPGFRVVKEE